VRERRYGPGFASKPRAHLCVERRTRWEHFDRDGPIQTRVGAAEDLSHATSAERALYAVRPQHGARSNLGAPIEQRCRA